MEKPTQALGEGLGQETLEPGYSDHHGEGAIQASTVTALDPVYTLMGGCGLQV